MIEKYEVNGKWKKKYEKVAKTPYRRMLENEHVSEEIKEKLRQEHEKLNPLVMKKEIDRLKNASIEDLNPLKIELYKKFSMAFAALVFVFIGMPFGITTKRSERSIGFAISLGIIICYYLLSVVCESLSLKGKLQPLVACWLPNSIVILTGLILTWKVAES